MITVILTIHTLIVLGLIGIVLLQRSEGGALGIGGGGGGGGFMTSRGAANALTRTTSILAALFFATSISLAIFADRGESDRDVIEGLTGEEIADPNAPISADDLSNALGGGDDDVSEAPSSDDLSDALGGADTPADVPVDVNVEEALDDALGAEQSDPAPEEPAPATEEDSDDTPPPSGD